MQDDQREISCSTASLLEFTSVEWWLMNVDGVDQVTDLQMFSSPSLAWNAAEDARALDK